MDIEQYEIILFDAANTIMHKPDLWDAMLRVLKQYGISVNKTELKKRHKILSEIIHFPDRTSSAFYKNFNYELFISLGIVPNDELLEEVFKACSYLPWKVFEDTDTLKKIPQRKAILSNFNSSLVSHVESLFGSDVFNTIIGSEVEGIGKPNAQFYKRALDILNIEPSKILYVGDSIKLDIVPAQMLGIDAWLIDRDGNFQYFSKRIGSLNELVK